MFHVQAPEAPAASGRESCRSRCKVSVTWLLHPTTRSRRWTTTRPWRWRSSGPIFPWTFWCISSCTWIFPWCQRGQWWCRPGASKRLQWRESRVRGQNRWNLQSSRQGGRACWLPAEPWLRGRERSWKTRPRRPGCSSRFVCRCHRCRSYLESHKKPWRRGATRMLVGQRWCSTEDINSMIPRGPKVSKTERSHRRYRQQSHTSPEVEEVST